MTEYRNAIANVLEKFFFITVFVVPIGLSFCLSYSHLRNARPNLLGESARKN